MNQTNSDNNDINRLIINNLAVLEAAPVLIEQIQNKVFQILDSKIENWVRSQEGWIGAYQYLENETYFHPPIWKADSSDECYASYQLCIETGEIDCYPLSVLTGAVPDQFGLWFAVDPKSVTRLSQGSKKNTQWRKFLIKHFALTQLSEAGFRIVDDGLFIAFDVVDPQLLADCYPNSLDDALACVDKVLDILEKKHPEIDALLKSALNFDFEKSI
ncbi:MAG: hypothetical protein NVS3B3_11360 [Aquirhabdus sp.]